MPTLTEDSYLECMSLIGHPEGDILVSLYRDKPDADWMVEVRFRYKVDDKVFNSEDKKTWQHYRIPAEKSRETVRGELSTILDKLVELTNLTYGTKAKADTLEIQGGIEELVTASEKVDWVNIKKVPTHFGPVGEA